MPRIRFLATLAIMPLTMLGWFPVMAASSDPEARPPCSQLGGAHIRSAITLGGGESALDPDIRRVRLGNDVWVERLTGKAALAHLHNIMSRRPGAFDRARQSLRDRGFVPTETVYVERTIRLASTQPFGKGLVVPAQDYSESNEDGEILFWSWDDGDDATWEGSIYIEIYSDGAASTWEGQIDASNEEHNWIYYLKTWEGGPGPGEPLEARFDLAPPRPGHAPRIVTADLDLSGRNPYGRYLFAGSFEDWAHCWRACVVGGCATAAGTCILSGPAWPKCFGISCVSVEIGCGVSCYLAL